MTNVEIDFPENRKISINGEEFEVLLGDFEVLELADGLASELAGLDGRDAERVMKALKRALVALDKLLGAGATKRLLKGRAVSVQFMLDGVITPVISAVLAGAGEEYARRIAERYGSGAGGDRA